MEAPGVPPGNVHDQDIGFEVLVSVKVMVSPAHMVAVVLVKPGTGGVEVTQKLFPVDEVPNEPPEARVLPKISTNRYEPLPFPQQIPSPKSS